MRIYVDNQLFNNDFNFYRETEEREINLAKFSINFPHKPNNSSVIFLWNSNDSANMDAEVWTYLARHRVRPPRAKNALALATGKQPATDYSDDKW